MEKEEEKGEVKEKETKESRPKLFVLCGVLFTKERKKKEKRRGKTGGKTGVKKNASASHASNAKHAREQQQQQQQRRIKNE